MTEDMIVRSPKTNINLYLAQENGNKTILPLLFRPQKEWLDLLTSESSFAPGECQVLSGQLSDVTERVGES